MPKKIHDAMASAIYTALDRGDEPVRFEITRCLRFELLSHFNAQMTVRISVTDEFAFGIPLIVVEGHNRLITSGGYVDLDCGQMHESQIPSPRLEAVLKPIQLGTVFICNKGIRHIFIGVRKNSAGFKYYFHPEAGSFNAFPSPSSYSHLAAALLKFPSLINYVDDRQVLKENNNA